MNKSRSLLCFLFLAAFVFLIVSFFPVGEHLEAGFNTYHPLRCVKGAILKSFYVFKGMPPSHCAQRSRHVVEFGECRIRSLKVIATLFLTHSLQRKALV